MLAHAGPVRLMLGFTALLLTGCGSTIEGTRAASAPEPRVEDAVEEERSVSVRISYEGSGSEIPRYGISRIDDTACGPTLPGVFGPPEPEYMDMKPDAEVRMEDESGTLIGLATLGQGEWAWLDESPGADVAPGDRVFVCRWAAELSDVPVARFYTVRIGDIQFPTISADDMEQNDWTYSITIR